MHTLTRNSVALLDDNLFEEYISNRTRDFDTLLLFSYVSNDSVCPTCSYNDLVTNNIIESRMMLFCTHTELGNQNTSIHQNLSSQSSKWIQIPNWQKCLNWNRSLPLFISLSITAYLECVVELAFYADFPLRERFFGVRRKRWYSFRRSDSSVYKAVYGRPSSCTSLSFHRSPSKRVVI